MKIEFKAELIHTSKEDEYYLVILSDKEQVQHITIMLAYHFDAQDISLGMDGEYFEYGDENDMGSKYKCVRQVHILENSVNFILSKPLKNTITEFKVNIDTVFINDELINYLNIIFKDKLKRDSLP